MRILRRLTKGTSANATSLNCRSLIKPVSIVLGLGVLAALCYSNSFIAEFAFDNKFMILRDQRLRACNATTLKQIFSENYWWPIISSDLYRPLTTLSYQFNYTILGNGLRPMGYHVFNFLLHWANAVLVLALTRRISDSQSVAVISSIIFALHPIAVEAVTNVVGRADLLVTFFILLSALIHMRSSLATRQTERAAWLIGLAFSSTLAVLCKESAVMIVGLVLLYDFLCRWPSLEGGWGKRSLVVLKEFAFPDCIPLVPMLVVFAIARWHFAYESVFQRPFFVDNPIAYAAPFQGLMTALKVQGLYFGLLVLPAKLTCDYSYNHITLYGTGDGRGDMIAWTSIFMIILLLVLAWRFRKRNKSFAYGVLLYFILMVPTANMLKVIGSIMAERFLYLPSVGFALVGALGLDYLGRRFTKSQNKSARNAVIVPSVLMLIIASGLGYRTYLRNGDWSNELMLWESAVRVAPDSFKTHKNYATAIFDSNPTEAGVDTAIVEAEKGIAILDRPEVEQHLERRDATLFIDTGHYYATKAEFCLRRGVFDEANKFNEKAVAILERAVEVDTWVKAKSLHGRTARGKKPATLHTVGFSDIHLNLAIVLLRAGRFGDSLARATQASHLAPFAADIRVMMASSLLAMGRPEDAAIQEIIALIINADLTQAWNGLHDVYARLEPGVTLIKAAPGGKFSLVTDHPRVRLDLIKAFIEYANLLESENYHREAEQVRQTAIRNYGYPSDIFR